MAFFSNAYSVKRGMRGWFLSRVRILLIYLADFHLIFAFANNVSLISCTILLIITLHLLLYVGIQWRGKSMTVYKQHIYFCLPRSQNPLMAVYRDKNAQPELLYGNHTKFVFSWVLRSENIELFIPAVGSSVYIIFMLDLK